MTGRATRGCVKLRWLPLPPRLRKRFFYQSAINSRIFLGIRSSYLHYIGGPTSSALFGGTRPTSLWGEQKPNNPKPADPVVVLQAAQRIIFDLWPETRDPDEAEISGTVGSRGSQDRSRVTL